MKGNCSMQIWVDADACPGEIKELLYRAAERVKIKRLKLNREILSEFRASTGLC
jgi:uncharacterized protein YaiI (UPF0178 family)